MIQSISSFEIIRVVKPNPKIFFRAAESVTDAATVNPDGIKTLLANAMNTFFIKAKPNFSGGPRSLLKNPPDCPILKRWVFDQFILTDERFVKALMRL